MKLMVMVVVAMVFSGLLTSIRTESQSERIKLSRYIVLALSPEGKQVLVATATKQSLILDSRTGKVVQELAEHNTEISCGAYWPNGQKVALGEESGLITVWDCATGQLSAALRGHKEVVVGLQPSLSGKYLASSAFDDTSRLWDVSNVTQLRSFTHKDDAFGAILTSDDKFMVTGGRDATITIRSIATGKTHDSIPTENTINRLAISPDDNIIAATGRFPGIVLWKWKQGRVIKIETGVCMRSLAFNDSGTQIASGDDDGRVSIWQTSGPHVMSFTGENGLVTALRFLPDGRLMSSVSIKQLGLMEAVQFWPISRQASSPY